MNLKTPARMGGKLTQAIACSKCDTARANARGAGHRDWREGACFDCAAGDLDAIFARIGYVPNETAVARELAKMNAGHVQRAKPAAPVQLSLFGEAA